MKYFTLIILLSFYGCKPTGIIIKKVEKSFSKTIDSNYRIMEKTELIPKHELKIYNDEWGKKYVKLLPGKQTILKYVYSKKPIDKTLMDAGYTQIVWLTLDTIIKNQSLKPENLKDDPLYVQIAGFRNSQFIPVKNAEVVIKILDKIQIEFSITIDSKYSNIVKKDIHQIIDIKE